MLVESKVKVGVVPSGSLGSVFAKISAEQGHQTTLYHHNPDTLDEFKRSRISKRLPNIVLPESIKITSDIIDTVADKDVVFVAVPSEAIEEIFERIDPSVGGRTALVIGTKGLVGETNSTVSSFILGKQPGYVDQIAVMSGPNKALELAAKRETGTVIASYNPDIAERFQRWFSTPYFRIYTADDIIGVEAGGALKNIFAFGVGIAKALDAAGNSEALYITRALAEMKRLGMALGAKSETTFDGLSGMGDLYLSCVGEGTRNSRAGEEFAKGKSVEQLLASGELIEGLYTIKRAYALALEKGIDAPFTIGLYRVLYEGLDIQEGIQQLMGRRLTREYSGFDPRRLVGQLGMRFWHRLRGTWPF
ncbi:NAD(P)-dependent glycerol-3-phosphate dehydrogenase [Candidatus Microgenomates bacterium]|nr:NAD(P)-dependent glycerol-3-phosphate dehydrogenase [Candidatus Microgenomates bacterium]